jgi:SPASM domain peptide maturase of grasp-with-spasm system
MDYHRKKIPQHLPFKKFACCIPVKGFARSIIYDLNRSRFSYIPNSLFKLLTRYEGQTIHGIKSKFNAQESEIIDEYFSFLIEREYIFFCKSKSELKRFPDLGLSFKSPSLISNAIIQIKDELKIDLPKVISELTDLGCRFVQITLHGNENLRFAEKLLDCFAKSPIRSVELFLKFNISFSDSKLIDLVKRHNRVHHLLVYGAPEGRILKPFNMEMQAISFIQQSINCRLEAAVRDTSSFRTNIDLFCESQTYNTYFNQKVVIDWEGRIKNVPNSELTFGSYNTDSLKKVVATKKFQKLWKVKKDKIETCRDCEYRYMCVDNRIPVKKDKKWVHTRECNYDVQRKRWK